jgi:hypothetical protein
MWLREKLVEKYPFEAIPLLPEKDFMEKLYPNESDRVRERMNKLKHFLTILVNHPEFPKTDEVKDFLVDKDEFYFSNCYKEEQEKKNPKSIKDYALGMFKSLKGNYFNLKAPNVTKLSGICQ